MAAEARLAKLDSGLAPASEGWFVVNVRDAAWITNDAFGARLKFETNRRVLGDRDDVPIVQFPELGVTLQVIEPGQPSGMYHADSDQEDFLVLAGECTVLVEGEERQLRAWDFVHCAPGTEHVFLGAGAGPCVIFMTGRRTEEGETVYPRSELALRHEAGVEQETSSPHEAYAAFPHWEPARPRNWGALPWA